MDDYGALAQAAGGVTAIGLVAWLVKRTFTHTIPRLAQDFKESLTAQTNLFQTEMRESRENFREELRLQREEFREELRLQREDLRSELRSFGSRIDGLTGVIESLRDSGEFSRRDTGEIPIQRNRNPGDRS